jgi:hypothetical protein
MTTDIVQASRTEMQREEDVFTDGLLRAAADPNCDVEKLERLMAMKERGDAQRRRTAFMAAMARLQAELPQVTKSGAIMNAGGPGKAATVRNTYAKIEDIDVAVRPLCTAEGFSFSLDAKAVPGGTEYTSTMSHREGHAETRTLILPPDSGGGRSAAQCVGSNLAYARRYLLMMHLNLVTRDIDNDGQGEPELITPEQVDELRAALKKTGRNEARLLLFLKVGSLDEIPAHKFKPTIMLASEPLEPSK